MKVPHAGDDDAPRALRQEPGVFPESQRIRCTWVGGRNDHPKFVGIFSIWNKWSRSIMSGSCRSAGDRFRYPR